MFFDFLKTIPQYLIPQQGLNALAARVANLKVPLIKNYLIQRFIRLYQVNMAEALVDDPSAYACFNDFFIRHLKAECRIIAHSDLISPVDGSISEIGSIKEGQLLQAKNRYYSVQELLACDTVTAAQFAQGKFATLYLSPKDYHRVHLPMDARLTSMTYIPGSLFSVQPTTTRVVPRLFARNERLAVFFNTAIGPMALVLVGAAVVGAIGTSWGGDIKYSKKKQCYEYAGKELKQGDEVGYFKLGSTVVLLFAEGGQLSWAEHLTAGKNVRFGQALGKRL